MSLSFFGHKDLKNKREQTSVKCPVLYRKMEKKNLCFSVSNLSNFDVFVHVMANCMLWQKKEKKIINNRGWTVKLSWSCIGEWKNICAGLFINLFSSSADIKNFCPFLFQMWTCRNKQSLYHFKTKTATEFKGSQSRICFPKLADTSKLLNMVDCWTGRGKCLVA